MMRSIVISFSLLPELNLTLVKQQHKYPWEWGDFALILMPIFPHRWILEPLRSVGENLALTNANHALASRLIGLRGKGFRG